MEKEHYEKILDNLGIKYVKSKNLEKLNKEELNNLSSKLSGTNFTEIIDNKKQL